MIRITGKNDRKTSELHKEFYLGNFQKQFEIKFLLIKAKYIGVVFLRWNPLLEPLSVYSRRINNL